MMAVKFFFIFSLSFSLALLVSSKSRVIRIISVKWSFDVMAVLILGSAGESPNPEVYAFALILVGFGVLFSFIWMMLKNEGFKDYGKL